MSATKYFIYGEPKTGPTTLFPADNKLGNGESHAAWCERVQEEIKFYEFEVHGNHLDEFQRWEIAKLVYDAYRAGWDQGE